MPLQLVVRDYLAVHEAKMLVKGLTILKGESFQGKSSLIRALRDAFTNSFTSSCVRWGADCAEIKVLFPGNHLLRITRTSKGVTQMQFDGETFEKIGRVVPDSIAQFLNLGQVKFGAEQYNLNFYDQFQPPLLLSCSHKRLAELLSSSSALSDYSLLQKALDSRKNELKGSFTTLDGLMSSVKTQLSVQSEYLDKAEPIASDLRKSYVALNEEEHLVESLSELADAIQEMEHVDRLQRVRKDALQSVDALSREYDVHSGTTQLLDLMDELDYRSRHTAAIMDLDSSLSVLHKTMLHVERFAALGESIETVSAIDYRMSQIKERLQILNDVDCVLSRVELFEKRVKDATLLLESIETLGSLEHQIEELQHRSADGICPLCGREIIDEDMTREEVAVRRKQLEESLRQNESTAAVLRSRIHQLSESLGLQDPTIEQIKQVKDSSAMKIAQLESDVEEKLEQLNKLEARA